MPPPPTFAAAAAVTSGPPSATPQSSLPRRADTEAGYEHSPQLMQIFLANSGMDEQLGNTLKSYFRIQRQDSLVDQLSAIVVKKEQDIEKLCNSHYQEFVQSVDQLLHVRSETVQLRANVQRVNSEFQESGAALVQKKADYLHCRKVALNIDSATETLQQCLFVLELASKAMLYIEDKKYYSALKTLDELQQYYLPQIIQYDFARHLQERIPAIQHSVKEAVLVQMKEWLVNIRSQSRQVGALAMAQAKRRAGSGLLMGYGAGQVRRSARVPSGLLSEKGIAASQSLQSLRSIEMVVNEENEIDVTNNSTVQVDFRPLYQCLHIHEVLGMRTQFRRNYEENRRLQANLVLSSYFSLNEQELGGFEMYLQEIIGFFIVEYKIGSTTDGFRPRASIDVLWDATNSKLYEVIVAALQNCENPQHFLKIKELMITFIQAAEQFSYSVHRLVDMLLTFFERYSELLKAQSSVRCRTAIMADECNEVLVHDQAELADIQRLFKFQTDPGVVVFPKVLPFTSSLLTCVDELRQLISLFHKFSDGFHQNFNEMDDILRKSVEDLFVRNICLFIGEKVVGRGIRVSEVVRMLRNLEFFGEAIAQIDKLMRDRRLAYREALRHHPADRGVSTAGNEASASMGVKTSGFLTACQVGIRDTQKNVEARLFEVMSRKVEDFIDCADYDYCPSTQLQPRGTPSSPVKSTAVSPTGSMTASKEPSAYLTDMVSFLKAVWQSSLVDLPASTKSLLYYSTFYNISSALMKLLVQNPGAKRLSPIFLHTVFWRDLEYLRDFVSWVTTATDSKAGAGVLDLGDQLLEVQQACYLCTGIPIPSSGTPVTSLGSHTDVDVEGYLDPAIRSRKFNRLDKATVVLLLERVLASGIYDSLTAYESLAKLERNTGSEPKAVPEQSGGSPQKAGWFGSAQSPQTLLAERERKELDVRRAQKKKSLEHVVKVLKERK